MPLRQSDAVRSAKPAAVLAAYEDAGIQGLCFEGRWEAALAAIHAVTLNLPAGTPREVTHRV